ncbi:MAG TPA: WecB/TagA/CpsF family glycosyltransferase [Acidocella sp.]|nr:WecB/TagA/CpsF family glycosyltransferase [Acidocella sp.]
MGTMNQPIIQLLGIDFCNIGIDTAVERLLARPEGARLSYVVTPNADHIERLLRIPGLRPIYRRALFCLLDSTLVSHVARHLGLATPPVVPGADLTEALLPHLSGKRVAVIGMDEPDFSKLVQRFPEISFIHYKPPMRLLHDVAAFNRTRDFVIDTQAAFTFFAVGSPVQEMLAYAASGENQAVGVGLCIGSSLSFAAGTVKRAPLWMRRAGLEWIQRLAHNPRRLAGRYLVSDPLVLLALSWTALREKFH